MSGLGMLWDIESKELASNIRSAADFYQRKYGARPDVAWVNPSLGDACQVDGIEVKVTRSVPKGHILIGVKGG